MGKREIKIENDFILRIKTKVQKICEQMGLKRTG